MSNGLADVTSIATWRSSSSAVSLSSTGFITAVASGNAVIIAAYQGVSFSLPIRVFGANEVQGLQVPPALENPVVPGWSAPLSATTTLNDGTNVNSQLWMTWSSSDSQVASVAGSPTLTMLTAVAPGTATVAAHYCGAEKSLTVTVSPSKPGQDTLQSLEGGTLFYDPVSRRVDVDDTVSYNVVSGPTATLTLSITQQSGNTIDFNGKNVGSNPPVAVVVPAGARAVQLKDAFVLPAGVQGFCSSVTMVVAGSGARFTVYSACGAVPTAWQ
jgi:hypothetical protein